MNKIRPIKFLMLCLLASACSLTKHLPEGETLYRGIKSIDYDKRQEAESKQQQEGVITALADAYSTVESAVMLLRCSRRRKQTKRLFEIASNVLRRRTRRRMNRQRRKWRPCFRMLPMVLSWAVAS